MRGRDEHRRFVKRLERERPQPSDDFLSTIANRMTPTRARHSSGWRLAVVAGLTMVLASALALTGGIGYAANAVKGGTTVVTTLVGGPFNTDQPKRATGQATASQPAPGASASNANNANSAAKQGNQQSAARNQYQEKVLICHRPPGSPENAHTISVSQNAV
ncbi:MAG: hypothetical protein H0W35_05240, partial [Actinobacteria bacterium]|nr:hypothetical protein [Actinomycetota bacterium]